MKNSIFILFLFLSNGSFGQIVSCHNLDFDQEVASMVDPNTSTLDVDTLYRYSHEYYIIDCRTKKEFDVSHIAGAHSIHFRAKKEGLGAISKDKKIAVYCSIGKRSDLLTQRLDEMGYNAFNVYGGIFEWVNRGLPIYTVHAESNQEIKTHFIHQYNLLFGKWVLNKDITTKGFILYD